MAVTVQNLTKRFGHTIAVDDLTFNVPTGVMFALLGTNGAGKSTLINCLTTLLHPDAGDAEVFGHSVLTEGHAVRERIGIVFQESLLDPMLTGAENLQFRARLHGFTELGARKRIEELSELLDFQQFQGRRYSVLSGGQRRRLDIARALLHAPDLLFLDEPTTGLDPMSREAVWNSVEKLREQGGLTVFLTTHYMEETERADQVCILDEGRKLVEGSPAQLRAQHSPSVLTITSSDPQLLAETVAKLGSGLATIEADSLEAHVPTRVKVADAKTAQRILTEQQRAVEDFEFRHGTMDDVFLTVTGKKGQV